MKSSFDGAGSQVARSDPDLFKVRFPYFILLYLILFYFGSEYAVLNAFK